VPYILTYGPSHLRAPPVVDWRGALPATEAFWRDWSAKSTYAGRWRQPMQRSLLTLKALTYATTGGIIAAPATSLPEQLGGQRNCDYRYSARRHVHSAGADVCGLCCNQHFEADGAIAVATKGKGAVKSSPFRVFSRTPALSHRAMMRKPSYLIS
jgi:hypothetical protein